MVRSMMRQSTSTGCGVLSVTGDGLGMVILFR